MAWEDRSGNLSKSGYSAIRVRTFSDMNLHNEVQAGESLADE